MSLNQRATAEFSTYVHQVLLTASDLSIQTNDRQVSNVVELACDSKARYGRKGSPEGPRSRKPMGATSNFPAPASNTASSSSAAPEITLSTH
jgi:hypothetical protein